VVALTDIDSNNYNAVLRFKKTLSARGNPTSFGESISLPSRKVNEYGETVAGHMIQEQKRLSDEEIQRLIKEYQNGKSACALAKQFGCHRTTVSNVLKKCGVNVTNRKAERKLNISDVVAMYEENHTSEKIAKKYEVSPQAVIRCLREQGITIRSRWDY
jgi:DNA invertase Pin-like site-specific DNA recombinase